MSTATGPSVLLSAVLLVGCSGSSGSDSPCSPLNCGTCCDSGGHCVAAVSPAACPSLGHGSACTACAGGEDCYAGPGRCGPANPAFAFVTSVTYTGRLALPGSGTAGLLGGDALCQAAAASAGAQVPAGPTSAFRDELGGAGPGAPVWTGTKPDGTRATSIIQGTTGNCIDWSTGTLGSDSGVTGSNGFLTGSWTERSAQQCHNQGALYCFQQ